MKPTRLLICLVAFYSAGAPHVPAQREANTVRSLESLPVYVVDFRQSEPIREIDLASFATSLIHLRLLEIPSLTVHRVPKPPPCGNLASRGSASTQVETGPGFQSSPAPSGDFYVVRGSIGVRLPDIVLDYFVDKCEGQTTRRVLQDTQPFTLDHAREELTIAAHAIGYKIERVTPLAQITVEAFQIEGDVPDPKGVQETIRRELTEAMSKFADFEVSDAGDYRVGGSVTFQKGASLLRPLAKGKLQAELHVEAREKAYPMKPLTGSRDKLEEFYARVAQEVQRILPQVLLAEHLGLPQVLGNLKVDELLSRGSQLIDECTPDDHDCASAQLAIPLLASAVQQAPLAWKALWLLGRAQMSSGKYADAAGSLVKASNLIKQDLGSDKLISPLDQVQVFNLLGDVYRNIEKYSQAEAAYDESLRIMPSQPELYASKALALRFDGKRWESVQALLEGIRIAGSETASQPLHEAAKDVIRALQKDDFDKAEGLLAQAYRAGEPVANEYALLLSRKWGALLDANWTPENRGAAKVPLQKALDVRPSDPDVKAEVYASLARMQLVDGDRQVLHSFLDQAEKLPVDQVSAFNREWVARIRARDQIDNYEYEKARASADLANRIRPTDDATFLAASATFLLAEAKEKSAGASSTERAMVQNLYQQSADLAAPLVAKRYTEADIVFTRASHPLDRDKETRKQFERFLKQDPKDVSALNALMFVCSQYLADFNCAFSAAQQWVTLPGGPDMAPAYLDLAEVAVLAGKDEIASEWLAIAMGRPGIEPMEESIVCIFRLWLAMRKGRNSEFSHAFQAWQAATERFRKTNRDFNWLFLGARKALKDDRIDGKEKQVLGAMMDALEDKSRPLPSWPESEVL